MSTSSPQPYYLPEVPGDVDFEVRACQDETMTDDSTLNDSDQDHDRNTSLSGTTLGEERESLWATAGIANPEYATLPGLSGLYHGNAIAPSRAEFVRAFNNSTNNPLYRASNRLPPRRAVVNRPPSPPIDPSLRSTSSGPVIWNCNDFIDRLHETIQIQGLFNDIWDLDNLTSQQGFVRQETSGEDQLCGLHALAISLNATLAPILAQRRIPNFSSHTLRAILLSDEYRQYSRVIYSAVHDAATRAQLVAELSSPRNLSVEQLSVITFVVGRQVNHPLQLGVCVSSPPDSNELPSLLYHVYRNNHNRREGSLTEEGATTIWLINENMGGKFLNHWSGMAPRQSFPNSVDGQVANLTPQPRKASSRAMPAKKVAKKRVKNQPQRFMSKGATGKSAATSLTPLSTEIYCPKPGCKRRFHEDVEKRKPFKDNKALEHHLKTVHIPYSERKHVCEVCPDKLRFIYPKDLERHHTNKHAEGHPQWCLVKGCQRAGKGQPKSNLKRHYEVHTQEEWELCKTKFNLYSGRSRE